MPVAFAVREVQVEADTGLVYFDVDFWPSIIAKTRGDEPFATEDFRMQIQRTVTRIVTDANGWWKRLDGVFVDPATVTEADEAIGWEREEYTKTRLELLAEIRGNIRRHADVLEVKPEWRGDRRLRQYPRFRVGDALLTELTELAELREARTGTLAARLGR